MIAVFAVLAAIAMVSGWRGEPWSSFWSRMGPKAAVFAAIFIVMHLSVAYAAELALTAFTVPLVLVFDTLLIASVALAFYGVGRLSNATTSRDKT